MKTENIEESYRKATEEIISLLSADNERLKKLYEKSALRVIELLNEKIEDKKDELSRLNRGGYTPRVRPNDNLLPTAPKGGTGVNSSITVIDLDQNFWEQIKQSAEKSKWIPKEYYKNDWVSDVCDFLENGYGTGFCAMGEK